MACSRIRLASSESLVATHQPNSGVCCACATSWRAASVGPEIALPSLASAPRFRSSTPRAVASLPLRCPCSVPRLLMLPRFEMSASTSGRFSTVLPISSPPRDREAASRRLKVLDDLRVGRQLVIRPRLEAEDVGTAREPFASARGARQA